MLLLRPAWLPEVHREGPEHAALHVEDGCRPAGAKPERQTELLVVAPERVGGDVFGDHRAAEIGRGTAGPRALADLHTVESPHVARWQARCGAMSQVDPVGIEQQDRRQHARRLFLDGTQQRGQRFGEGRSLRNHLQHAVLRLDHALGLQPPCDVGDRADVAIEAAVAVAFRTGKGKRPPYGPVGAKEPELAGVDLLTGGSQAPFLPHARDVLRMDHSEPALLDRLLPGKPRHLREMRVDVRRRSGETRLEDADGSDVGERVIPALAVAQRLIGSAAFRDVVCHAQQAGDLPLRIAQRHCLRLEPAPRALQADHLELESAAVALHDLSMQNAEGRAIRRRDELDERLTLSLFERLGLQHRQARGVHLEQPAILRDDLHARRLGLQETLAGTSL